MSLKPVLSNIQESVQAAGLRCAFCKRVFKEVGPDGVTQVDVGFDGKVDKRWYGGSPVWRCWICGDLEIDLALDGRRVIKPHISYKHSKSWMKKKIVDQYVASLLRKLKNEMWNR